MIDSDDHVLVRCGRSLCGDLAAGLRREWLVTNGLGGYASGTLSGVATRRYHGLLVAALTPPVGRTVLVGGSVERATYNDQRYELSTHEYQDGTIDPHGYVYVQSFHLEGMLPVWVFALADALLERYVWMAHGANTTYVTYRLVRATGPVDLQVIPLVTYRDFHALSSGRGWQPGVTMQPQGALIRAFEGAVPFRMLMDTGTFASIGEWYWNFHHREETARGLDDCADLFAPGVFSVTLQPGDECTLVLTTEQNAGMDGRHELALARQRQMGLLRQAGVDRDSPFVRQLTLAADQFIVARPVLTAKEDPRQDTEQVATTTAAPAREGQTVIAGYHWFNDWGRDTMITLPGLTLATGRLQDGASILRTFAQCLADGLLPNNFPDHSGIIPGYNTADATLWYVVALYHYHQAAGDDVLVHDLLPALRDIVDHHVRGTRYGIGVDPADGLLHAGEPGLQLTWMDAKVGDWVVTPRIGKPVEINALWYNVLRIAALFFNKYDTDASQRYTDLATQVLASFRRRFKQPGRASLADVVDGPDGDDASVRPNQIFALSLPFSLLEGADASAVLDAVGHTLLTTYGLRSLSPADQHYQGSYGGDQRRRDGAYHQGTVWTWLLGPYAEAHYRVHGDRNAALALLAPLADHLYDAGLGTLSEIFDGDPPHLPRGCIAQAWSVAEILRVWRNISSTLD